MSKPLKRAALSPTPPRQTPDERRWELHYEILEQYIRRAQKMPSRGTLFEGIDIGTWYAYQTSRAELGLLTSVQQMKFDSLDAVLSEVTPSPLLSPILASAEYRRPTRPLGDYNIRATAPPPKPSALPKRIPSKVTADAVPPAQPEAIAPETTVHPVPAATEAADARAASDSTTPEETIKPEEAAVTTVESTEEVTESKEISDLRELVTATTEFWQNHGRMPRKADRNIIVAGRKLPDWTWTLVPAINSGTLSDEHRAILETAPWWSLITERAVKQQRRAEIIAAKKSGVDEGTPTEPRDDALALPDEAAGDKEPAGEEASDTVVEDTPASVDESPEVVEDTSASVDESPEVVEDTSVKSERRKPSSTIPDDKKVFKHYTKDRPHRANPVARAASEAVADAAFRERETATVEKLPEVGLVPLTWHPECHRGNYGDTISSIRASRKVDTLEHAAEAIAYLSENGVEARAYPSYTNTYPDGYRARPVRVVSHVQIRIRINVTDVKAAVSCLDALGYSIYTITSAVGFRTED